MSKNTAPDPDLTPATVDSTPSLVSLALVGQDDGWGDVETIDLAPAASIRIPHVPVNRKLDGGIVDWQTGEIVGGMSLILLGRGQSRAQWDKAFSGASSGPPDCRSFDAVTPDPLSPGRKNDACATCEFNRWGEAGDVARCRLSEQWLVFALDDQGGQYARIRWGGIAAGPAARYWESFSLRKPKAHPASVITEVTLVPTETDNGTFLAPQFTRGPKLERADVAPLLADLPMLRAAFAGAVAEAVAAGDNDEDVARAAQEAKATEPFPEYDKPMGGEAMAAQLTGATTSEDVF